MKKLNVGGIVLFLSLLVVAIHAVLGLYLAPRMLEIASTVDPVSRSELEKSFVMSISQPIIYIPLVASILIMLVYPIVVISKNRGIINSSLISIVCLLLIYLFSAYLILAVACLLCWLIQQLGTRNESSKPAENA